MILKRADAKAFAYGTDMKVQQELLRHSEIQTTMNTRTQCHQHCEARNLKCRRVRHTERSEINSGNDRHRVNVSLRRAFFPARNKCNRQVR